MRVFAPQGLHVAPMGVKFDMEEGTEISPAAEVAKNVEFLSVCLSVCLFVTLLKVRDCAPDFAMKALGVQKRF